MLDVRTCRRCSSPIRGWSKRSTASSFSRPPRRDAGDRRRIRLRQERDRAVADAAGARPAGPDRRRLGRSSTAATCSRSTRPRCATIRGKRISMIFQEPMTSLNPVMTIGDQIAEVIRLHATCTAEGGLEAGRRDAAPGAHPRTRAARQGISAPALRRHAPARHDRDGAGLQAGGADRRRADHRARRHHPGADPRADRSTCRASSAPR